MYPIWVPLLNIEMSYDISLYHSFPMFEQYINS